MLPTQRILIIRPSALGDVVRTVPCLASLRAAFPHAHIDWLVQEGFEAAISHHPALSGVVVFPKKAIKAAMRGLDPEPLRQFLSQLRENRYDLVYDLQGLARSGIFTWATGAPRRVGLANARELGWIGYTERHRIDIETHTVDRMLELLLLSGVAPVRDMRIYSPPPPASATDVLPPGEPYIVLASTSRWIAKQWPAQRFAALTTHLLARNRRVVLVGARGEEKQIAPLLDLAAAHPRVINLVGRTGVGELMRIIEHAALVVANDSAALHMAVGFARPIVALFGPTRVHRVGPYGREGDVLQHITVADRLDHKDDRSRFLMDRITTEEVAAACDHRLPPGL